MTFGTHATFYLREGWTYKILEAVKEDQYVFSDPDAPVILGVGKNMVNALRFWGSASGLITYHKISNKYGAELTEFGELVYKNDIYLENIETIWLMHLNLVSKIKDSTSWYWLFNEYPYDDLSLDYEDFPNLIQPWIEENYKSAGINKPKVSPNTLKRDIKCLTQTYLKNSTKNPEDNLNSPFSELNLFLNGRSQLTFNSLKFHDIPPLIFKQTILSFLSNNYPGDVGKSFEVDIYELISKKFSPGRVLRLSNNAIYDHILHAKEKDLLEGIEVRRTAGLDQIRLFFNKNDLNENQKLIMEGLN